MNTFEERGKRYYIISFFKSGFSEIVFGAHYGDSTFPTEFVVCKSWIPGKYDVRGRCTTGVTVNERSKTFTVEKREDCKEIFQHALEYFNYCEKELLWDVCL